MGFRTKRELFSPWQRANCLAKSRARLRAACQFSLTREEEFPQPARNPHVDCVLELLERDQDLHKLAASFDEVVAGRGRIALVSGEAGIGKTSFVDHFIESRRSQVCALKDI